MQGGRGGLFKIGGLAIVVIAAVATALILVVGGDPAPATELCPEADYPCEEPYPSGIEIEATLEKGTEAILSGAATVKCRKSTVVDKIQEGKGSSLRGEITSLTFADCSTCEAVESLAMPWEASVETAKTGRGDGLLVVGKPKIVLSGCTFFKVTCPAMASEMTLEVVGGRPAKVLARKEAVRLPGEACGTEGALTATYEVLEPSPLFVGP